MRPADTSPEAWKVNLDCHRRLTPAERLSRAFAESALLREQAMSMFRRDHPQAGEREIFLREAQQRFGAELFHKVYGEELAQLASQSKTGTGLT